MGQEPTPRSLLTKIGGWTLGRTLGRGAYGQCRYRVRKPSPGSPDCTSVLTIPAHVREATHVSGRKAACKILPALHRDPFRAVTTDELVDAVEAHKEVVLLKALTGVGLEGVIESGGWT
jgi:hypothetical protein